MRKLMHTGNREVEHLVANLRDRYRGSVVTVTNKAPHFGFIRIYRPDAAVVGRHADEGTFVEITDIQTLRALASGEDTAWLDTIPHVR